MSSINIKKIILRELKYIPTYINLLGPIQWYKFYKAHISKKMFKFQLKGYKFPIYLRGKTTDTQVFKQVFLEKEYKYKYDFPTNNIIDCGANVGYTTLFFANKFPKAKIIGIEPETSNLKMMEKNCKNYKNITILKGGVWSKTSELTISNKNAHHWSFQVKEVPKGKGEFKGYSLNDIMKKYKLESIDILKMDIEGSEKEIFKNNYEQWLSKTKLGFVEVHERHAKGVTKIVNNRLNQYKYKTKVSGDKLVFYK